MKIYNLMEDVLSKPWKPPADFAHKSAAAINRVLQHAGLRIARANDAVHDLRGITADPVEGAYRAGRDPFVIDVPLSDCRILPSVAFPCTNGCSNPFVETLTGYARGTVTHYDQSPLADFHRTWQPSSAAEVLGLTGEDISPILLQAPPLGFTMPWSGLSSEESFRHWKAIIEADNQEHGVKVASTLGWKSWGPVAPAVGELEFSRLVSVYNSLQQHGYKRSNKSNGDIEGVVLLKGGEYRILVTTGHHRSAALTAIGLTTIPLRLVSGKIVRRDDVDTWPNVRSGLFTQKQALDIFDRLFEGRKPEKCRWPQ